MGVLTWLTQAVVTDNRNEIDGRTLTRPALLVTDGTNIIYAVDVDIGVVDTTGYDQSLDLTNAGIVGTALHNVPIARGNADLIYADVGAAVRLRRSGSGRYEVVGFSQQMPGKNVRVGVDLGNFTFGQVEDKTITARALTFAELATIGGGFGTAPWGAIAIYKGSTLIGLK